MPNVPVPKDLATVKTKVALNLTKRQLICFSLAGLLRFPLHLLARPRPWYQWHRVDYEGEKQLRGVVAKVEQNLPDVVRREQD